MTTNDASSRDESTGSWERKTIEELLFEVHRERKRQRRWRIVLALLVFTYLFTMLFMTRGLPWPDSMGPEQYTAVIDIEGMISEDSEASAAHINEGLRKAFEDEAVAGILLKANSPGGSAVQAGYVYQEIQRLKAKHDEQRVIAVVTDMCASGCYYIAAAADEIYADEASLVGSIGVRMGGFGFVGLMEKLGIERRLLTAGEHKDLYDPFQPVDAEDKEHLMQVLDDVHQQFIERVKTGRGDRLNGNDDELFSGLIWSGAQAQTLGLIDGLGSPREVARDVFGATSTVDFTQEDDLLKRLERRIGSALARGLQEVGAPALEMTP